MADKYSVVNIGSFIDKDNYAYLIAQSGKNFALSGEDVLKGVFY